MDEEIKNIPELEKALEEQTVGDVPDLKEPTEQLAIATQSLSELQELSNTIHAEGVSQEDIQSVFNIIKRLNDAGIEVGVSTGLEEYGLGFYTKTRSMVNQTISQEGLGETIINVIKAVFEKLIAFVTGAIRFFRVIGAKDKVVQATVKKAVEKIALVAETVKGWKRLSVVSTDEVEKKAFEYAEQLLRDGSFPKSQLTLAAFGDKSAVANLEVVHHHIQTSARYLRISVKSLKTALDGSSDSVQIYENMSEGMNKVRGIINTFLQESPEPEYLIGRVDLQVLLGEQVHHQVTPVVQYEYIIKAYYDIAADLRSIRKFNLDGADPVTVQTVTEAMEIINKAFEDLGLAVDFFAKAKMTQQMVLKQHLQFMNRYASMMYMHVRDTAITEVVRGKVEAGFSQLESKLKTYGV